MNKKATSFLEFWKLVRELKPASDEAILFRGHPDEKWFLEPGVFRTKEKDQEVREYHNILVEYPEEFQNRSHLSNLVKMQHYGVSTRLLDFTTNPLVALFFASEIYEQKTNGQVICIKVKKSDILHHNSDRILMLSCLPCFHDDERAEMRKFCENHRGRITEQYVRSYGAMHKLLHEIRGEYPGFECEMIGEDLLKGYFVAPFKDNERMKLQNGLFYLFGLDETRLDDKMEVHRITIEKNSKDEILDDLEMMNISNAHLYSGLERAAMKYKWRRSLWVNDR